MELIRNANRLKAMTTPIKRHPRAAVAARDFNPGVRLYLRGLKKQEEKIKLSQYAQRIKEVQETQGLTFHPQIT